MSTTTETSKKNFNDTRAGTVIPFEQINEPGCYICNWTGHLMRVPEDGVQPGRSPLINMIGHDPLFVTKISENPYIPVTKARLLAANWDVNINF